VGKAARLVKVLDAERGDSRERVACLRLQAMAWRQLAMIALVDQAYARPRAQWLMFQSVPFVNGEALKQFIEETKDKAEQASVDAGVCVRADRGNAT
jgi:hypothetical protein